MSGKTLLRISLLPCVFCFFGWGCSRSGGSLSKADLESKVAEFAKLKDVRLTEAAKGNFSGTATGHDGTTYKITVTYTHTEGKDSRKDEIHWDAEDPKGGHSSGSDVHGESGNGTLRVEP